MKIFTISQTGELDKYTIENEPVSHEALMKRAALRFTEKLILEIPSSKKIFIFSGPGNNGGDAQWIARFLDEKGYTTELFDCSNKNFNFPEIKKGDLVIDGLFGAGINRPLEGAYAKLVKYLNNSGAIIYSIDIPSGLFGENNSGNNPQTIIKAYKTFTFQYPKLSFFFAENEVFTGKWEVINIDLHPDIISKTNTPYLYTEKQDVEILLKKRCKFDHKGIFGHALIVAGSKGKYGAAILASRACLRSGVGLLTTHVPADAEVILQTSVPEAMVRIDKNREFISENGDLAIYSAIGVGPGLGMREETEAFLSRLLCQKKKLILDADALNIISGDKKLMKFISPECILTPHPKEFDRLAGASANSFERLQKARALAAELQSVIILKGAYTAVCTPDKSVHFNPTGNPGMATAGSGDVLTGILTGLSAQGYSPKDASLLGVYIHGLAGDIAAKKHSEESLIAGDIIDCLGETFKKS